MIQKAGVSLFVFLLASFVSSHAASLQSKSVSITRQDGGSLKTELGYGIVLNAQSSLTREWITIHDASFPADIVDTVGVRTKYESGRVSGSYMYEASYIITSREALTAVDIRFLLFDVWGNHIRTLVASELVDYDPAQTRGFSGKWNLFSENEASEYYASIAYIARVRTKEGRVIEGNRNAALAEARKFSRKFTEDDLEPKPKREK